MEWGILCSDSHHAATQRSMFHNGVVKRAKGWGEFLVR